MAKKKLRVGILFGGRSGEHDVSLRSARSILQSIDRKRYQVIEIGIDKDGRWLQGTAAQALLHNTLNSAPAHFSEPPSGLMLAAASPGADTGLDIVFPVLHGTFGEDGTIQGLLELADIAYVGSGVLGSAAGMDKDIMKRLFLAAGLPITPHVTSLRAEWKADPKKVRRQIESHLRYPLFVKPANLGSSVGISKVHDRGELNAAMDLASSFDRKIVIEQGVGGPGVKPRELEVAVVGNDSPEVSVIGEIVPAREFYDYQAKYELNGPDESLSIIPARLGKAEQKKIRAMAVAAFRACDCAGLARIDFLMTAGSKGSPAEIVLNEVNTMPGFTSISMYPKLWQASGVTYSKLIDKLIDLGMHRRSEKVETTFNK